MTIKRLIVSTAVVVGLAGASAASAGEATRSSSALPTLQNAKASVDARRSVALKKKKSSLQESEAGAGGSSGAYIVGGLGVLAVGAGIFIAVDNNDSDADSGG